MIPASARIQRHQYHAKVAAEAWRRSTTTTNPHRRSGLAYSVSLQQAPALPTRFIHSTITSVETDTLYSSHFNEDPNPSSTKRIGSRKPKYSYSHCPLVSHSNGGTSSVACHPCCMTQRRLYHPPPQYEGGYVITPEMVIDFLDSHNVDTTLHRCTQTHVILRECPFCHKPSGGKADNLYKCYIRTNVPNSAYHCHRCGSGGSWYELKKRLGGFEVESLHQLAGRPQHRAMSTASAGGRGGSTAWRSSKFSVSAGTHPAATMRQPDYSKRAYEGYLRGPPPYSSPEQMARQIVPPLAVPSPHLQSLYTTTLLDAKTSRVRDYLVNERGLNLNTLRKYGVGQTSYRFPNEKNEWVSSDCVTFPWIMTVSQAENQEAVRGSHFVWTDKPSSTAKPNHDAKTKDSSTAQVSLKDSSFVTRRLKIRSIEEKSWQRMEPAGGGWGLFGWHTIPPDAKEVVITEGEYDAMAVYQATGRPAISLPNGCRSLPVEVLPMLDELEKIYLWMDNDAAGQEGAEAFAKKLGLERTYNVRPTPQNIVRVNQEEEESADNLQNVGTPKDANEALLNGLDLNRIIDGSQLVPHERIQTFQNLRTNVMHEILYPDKYTGTPIKSLPGLTSLMQGLRRGEMTVLTGPTGSGKTTFLGQVSIDLAESGMNVLWGSFEIKNTRLIHKLLQQFAREPLPKGDLSMEDKMEAIADRFERLPLHFLTFHGGSDVDQVLEAMDYAVYVNDVEHIILDNMQFMVSRNNMSRTFDKYDVQDVAIEKFRRFATDRNVHITLVVHPRKEAEDQPLSMASIYGSAKATQEADTVLILQKNGEQKWIEVKKNRFSGELGKCELYFDRKSCRYTNAPINPSAGGLAPPPTTPKWAARNRYQIKQKPSSEPPSLSLEETANFFMPLGPAANETSTPDEA